MKKKDVTSWVAYMKANGLTRLSINDADTNLSLELHPSCFESSVNEKRANVAQSTSSVTVDEQKFKSPLIGVFWYNKTNPIKKGSIVKKGDLIGQIEAMKMFNDVVADEDGEIIRVDINDGGILEYGQSVYTYKSLNA
jgi:acetyl-CoA carboxylase biotin carboxyl carrier protein